jgi:hypothetical protein
MKLDNLSPGIKKRLSHIGGFLFNHSMMIFIGLFLCGLIYAVLSLNLLLSKPSDDEYRTKKLDEARSVRFDQDTIDTINELDSAAQTDPGALPTNQRINPFSE